jgi:hypothetical protein
MGGFVGAHRREDVACNALHGIHSSHVYFLLPTSCFRLRLPTGVGSWARGAARAKTFRPTTRGAWIMGGLWVPHGVRRCVQRLYTEFTLHTFTSCFRLPASDFVSPQAWGHGRAEPPGAKTFRPLQRGVRGSWVDCGCPTGVKTLRAASLHGIHSSHVYFLLPPSCFRLRLRHRRGAWAACRRGENIRPLQRGGAWIMGGLWVPHRREDVACKRRTRNSFFTRLLPASDFLLPTFVSPQAWDMAALLPG